MRNISLGFMVSLFLFNSCTYYDYYTLSSPDKTRCITLEYSSSLNPSDSQYVKLFLGAPPVDEDRYVKMLWSDIGGFVIDWGSIPIKVRSWLVKESTFSANEVDSKLKMTEEENKEFHEKGSSWASYDFTWVTAGKYESCAR